MRNLITVIALLLLATATTFGQNSQPTPKNTGSNFCEIRWSKGQYFYVDCASTQSSLIVEGFAIGTTGQTQGFLGAGKQFKPGKIITIIPMGYVVFGSNNQVGVMAAALPNIEWGKIKSNAFLGWFVPIKGKVHQYLVLDTWDTTYVLSKKFDIGTSVGFFLQGGKWNPQYGPVLKQNDKLGSWTVSYRIGTGRELRFGRTFNF